MGGRKVEMRPLVLSTCGVFGPKFEEHIRVVLGLAEMNLDPLAATSPELFVQTFKKRVLVSLYEGQAQAVLGSLVHMQAGRGARFPGGAFGRRGPLHRPGNDRRARMLAA